MLKLIIALLIGIALGVVYHAAINPFAKRAWKRFNTWRKRAVRKL